MFRYFIVLEVLHTLREEIFAEFNFANDRVKIGEFRGI